jgi:hypothetical protein
MIQSRIASLRAAAILAFPIPMTDPVLDAQFFQQFQKPLHRSRSFQADDHWTF